MIQSSAHHNLPNIVLILADDMGYGDVGSFNPDSRIPTPFMDRLAEGGRCFGDIHSPSAVCTPSRYGLLTGRYCWRTSLQSQVLKNYEPPMIGPDRPTLATYLKGLGFDTACIGKWHLGLGWKARPGTNFDFQAPLPWGPGAPDPDEEAKIDFSAPITGGPNDLGFDYFFGTSGCATAQPPYGFIENDHMVDARLTRHESRLPASRSGMMAPLWRHEEADIAFTEKAVEYIRSKGQRGRGSPNDSASQPFFLYLAASAPHEPAIPEVVPDFARGMSDAGPRGDLVYLFDWMVGQVIQALNESGQLDNTLIIVTSDNGALPGHSAPIDGHPPWYEFGHSSSGEWRGHKGHIWEGGHREPFIAHWPDRIPAGTRSDALLSFTDLLPTLAGTIGAKALPHGAAEDGVDMSKALLGTEGSERSPEGEESHHRGTIVHHSVFGHFSFRREKWKLILGTTGSGGWPPPEDGPPDLSGPGQLYDLETDPGEQQNLFSTRTDIVRELTEALSLEKRSDNSDEFQANEGSIHGRRKNSARTNPGG